MYKQKSKGQPLFISNGKVVTPKGVLASGGVIVQEEYITEVGRDLIPPVGARTLDACGGYIAPGFIDLHVHGGNGADFMDLTIEAFANITRFHAQHGVTALLATSVAAPMEDLLNLLRQTREWLSYNPQDGSAILGVHLEGPYLNPDQAGAQDTRFLCVPSSAETRQIMAYADVLRRVTLAPELPGALDLVQELAASGVVVSAGHSMAREKELIPAKAAGLGFITHIYSCMSTMVREGPWRVPGLLELALADDQLDTEMIGDAKHLPPVIMRLVWKSKGPDHLCLISDAMAGAGRPVGELQHLGGKGGLSVIVEDGVAMLLDRTAFAGSITPLDCMVRNMVHLVGLTVEQVIPLVSTNPARVLHLDDSKGSIEPDKDADLVLLDDALHVQATIIRGQVVYQT